jgi:hypothetical protein
LSLIQLYAHHRLPQSLSSASTNCERSAPRTRIMGHRSLAEMYAKEVLSDVEDGAADVSTATWEELIHTGLRIVLHLDFVLFLKYGKLSGLYIRCRRVLLDARFCHGGVGGADFDVT